MKDKLLNKLIKMETKRQKNVINLIASENYTSKDTVRILGSCLTNKYAEGYIGQRFYGGCETIDVIEDLAIERLKDIFDAEKYHANVQPYSGTQANMAVYNAMLKPKDTILTLSLDGGAHLSHGTKSSFSGKYYHVVEYHLDEKGYIDFDEVEKIAMEAKPKLIIAGASSYSRVIDFKKFRQIADKCGAYLLADISHLAGLIVAGLHPTPVGYADFITGSTQKTLRGPRGGFILCKEKYAKDIDDSVFPGIQGGPMENVIAAKCQCFYEARLDSFKDYQIQVVKNIKAMERVFKEYKVEMISGGSDTHLLCIDTKKGFNLTGQEAQDILKLVGICVNKNIIPNDKESPTVTSGIRIGTPYMTSRGLKERDFAEIADIMVCALKGLQLDDVISLRVKEVLKRCK